MASNRFRIKERLMVNGCFRLLQRTERTVIEALDSFTHRGTGNCFPSDKAVFERYGVSASTMKRGRRLLGKSGLGLFTCEMRPAKKSSRLVPHYTWNLEHDLMGSDPSKWTVNMGKRFSENKKQKSKPTPVKMTPYTVQNDPGSLINDLTQQALTQKSVSRDTPEKPLGAEPSVASLPTPTSFPPITSRRVIPERPVFHPPYLIARDPISQKALDACTERMRALYDRMAGKGGTS